MVPIPGNFEKASGMSGQLGVMYIVLNLEYSIWQQLYSSPVISRYKVPNFMSSNTAIILLYAAKRPNMLPEILGLGI